MNQNDLFDQTDQTEPGNTNQCDQIFPLGYIFMIKVIKSNVIKMIKICKAIKSNHTDVNNQSD